MSHCLGETIWVKILRGVRTDRNFALFGLLSAMDDVELTDQQILLHAHNAAEKNMLEHHLPDMQKHAENFPLEIQDDTVTVQADNSDTIARLKELFGDKVEIV